MALSVVCWSLWRYLSAGRRDIICHLQAALVLFVLWRGVMLLVWKLRAVWLDGWNPLPPQVPCQVFADNLIIDSPTIPHTP